MRARVPNWQRSIDSDGVDIHVEVYGDGALTALLVAHCHANLAQDLDLPSRDEFEAQCRALRVPVLVIHGHDDVCQHVDKGRAFAAATSADLLEIQGGGHLPHVRDPVRVSMAITDFLRTRVAGSLTGVGQGGSPGWQTNGGLR